MRSNLNRGEAQLAHVILRASVVGRPVNRVLHGDILRIFLVGQDDTMAGGPTFLLRVPLIGRARCEGETCTGGALITTS